MRANGVASIIPVIVFALSRYWETAEVSDCGIRYVISDRKRE